MNNLLKLEGAKIMNNMKDKYSELINDKMNNMSMNLTQVVPNSPKQTAASTNAPTVPTVVTVSSSSSPASTSDSSATDALISQISELQKLENDKYIALDVLLKSNPTPENVAQRKTIINDITSIANIRSNLFDTLLSNSSSSFKVNEQLGSNLENTNTIMTLKKNENDARLAALNMSTQGTDNAKRMVDINTYFNKQYQARVKIMKLVVLLCFVIVFFIVLMHLGWLPQELVTVLVVVTLFAGLIYIGSLVNDMYQRSNMNFDEYNFPQVDVNQVTSKISQSKSKNKASDRACSVYNSVASTAASIEDSISSEATSLKNELTAGTPDPSPSSSSLPSANASSGIDATTSATATGTTVSLPSVESKLSESFLPLMSRMDKRHFNSMMDTRQPMAYDTENNFGKI
jgi:hypothetical protein